MYFFAPFTLYALEHMPAVRRLSSWLGLGISASALIAASFSTRIWHLILTQGVLYAVGGTMLYAPIMFYLEEWFIKKRGLAYGVMWSGVGASFVSPLSKLASWLTVYKAEFSSLSSCRLCSVIWAFAGLFESGRSASSHSLHL